MLKRFAYLAAGLLLCGAAAGKSAPTGQTVFDINKIVTETTGVLTVGQQFQDLHSRDIVISHIIYRNYSPIFTTTTLKLFQDEKGKLVGSAKFETSLPPEGKPAVPSPVTFNVVGKANASGFSLKAKNKIAGGADFHSRTVSFALTANIESFEAVDLEKVVTQDDLVSTFTYVVSQNVGGLGYDYNFRERIQQLEEAYLIYQKLSANESLNYKTPKPGSAWVKIWTPWGPAVVSATVAANIYEQPVLTLKGKQFFYQATDEAYNPIGDFEPTYMNALKTKYGQSSGEGLFGRILLGTFIVLDGGTVTY